MRDLWHAAADLVLGARCAGCDAPVPGLCRSCAAGFEPEPIEIVLPGLDVMAAGRHAGELRDAVLAWKVGGRSGLDGLMAHHLATAVVPLLGERDEVALVPVPGTRRARRERGRDLVADLARRTTPMLAAAGISATVVPALRLVRQTSDQHALGPAERRQNLAGSMRLARRPRRPVVVVDDVVTTGATLAEAVRALLSARTVEVLGAAAVAAAIRGP